MSNKIGYCPSLNVSIYCHFIYTTTYHLCQYKPSSLSTKELYDPTQYFLPLDTIGYPTFVACQSMNQ